MINKGKLLIIFTIIIILGGCGRKGDLYHLQILPQSYLLILSRAVNND